MIFKLKKNNLPWKTIKFLWNKKRKEREKVELTNEDAEASRSGEDAI